MGPEAAERVAEIGRSHSLTPGQVEQLSRLLDLLERDPHAPTTVRSPQEAADRHVADALSALAAPELARAATIADLGSGAGVPGLVLACALPSADVRLVEATHRKCAFIAAAAQEMGLANATVVCRRVEEWAEGAGAHGAVTARALAPQPVALEYAAPLLRPGGVFVDWRGRRDPGEERAAAAAAKQLGMERTSILTTVPFAGARDHHLHVFTKVAPTPERFPRRPGIARKRPLR
jgi:16S rRNA (guanine527-N7)-methyltransferase